MTRSQSTPASSQIIWLERRVAELEKQRDELLSALEYAASCLGTDGHDPIDAVIFRVKETK